MKKFLMVLALVLAFTVPVSKPADADLIRETVRGCLIGGSVLGGATYLAITPQLLTNAFRLPGYSILANNAVLGCALFGAGAAVGSVWAGFWDLIF